MDMLTKDDLEATFSKYPDILHIRHLVEVGLFPSISSVYKAIDHGAAPAYFVRGEKGIRFTKASVLRWLVTE